MGGLVSGRDDALYTLWNLGDNVIIAWTFKGQELRLLSVRHYAMAQQPGLLGGAQRSKLKGESKGESPQRSSLFTLPFIFYLSADFCFSGASERMKLSKSQISFSLSVDLKAGIMFTPLMMR